MKKIIYILSALLLGLVACNKTEFGMDQPKADETGLVAVTMQLQVPVPLQAYTKANNMADTPNIDYIKVAVFGTSGYPQAYTLAEPVNKYADENGTTFQFKVLLPVYEGEAHVHIIANGDETISFDGQDEESIMSVMKTTGNVGAYWARVVSLDGILPQKDQNGIMQTDTEGNFIPSDETKTLFNKLVLVRNFAEVRLLSEVAEADLHDISWTLVNVPTMGSVAPMAAGTYVDDFASYVYDPQTGKMVNGEKVYEGFMFEEDPMDYSVPTDEEITLTLDDPGFTFERFHPGEDKATCILMKARFKSDEFFTYYRLDLTDESVGGYFPLYRNYAYKVKIHKVGNRGSRSIADALNRDSGGNVSLSTEARKLTDISDGESRLYVEYVEKNFISGGTKGLWVQYVPDVTTGTVNNSSIVVEVKDGDRGTALDSDTPLTLTPTAESSQTGYYFYEFKLNDQSETTDLLSILKVSANNGKTGDDKSTLYRDITLRVIKKMDMTLSLDPKKVAGQNSTTILNITLPDGLSESMFPLEFYIEDINHTIAPTGKDKSGNAITVPVKVAKSLADDMTNSYYFIRTVASYEEYEANHVISTEFKTNKDASATTIYVANEYFKTQTINLLNDGVYVNPVNATVAFNVTSMEVEVEFADEETVKTWTVTPGAGVTITDLDGNALSGTQTGNGKFLMKFEANNSTTASATRTATVTSDGNNHDVTITQSPLEFSVTPTTQTVNFNATTATVTVHAEEGKAWTASITGPNGTNPTLSETSGTGTQTLTVTIPASEATSARQYTVTATMTDPVATATATITQRRTPASPYSFAANRFTFSGTTASAESADGGYITIKLQNASTNNNRSYLTMGNGANSRGTITITPVEGFRITGIRVTYSDADYADYDFGNTQVSVNTGTYTREGNNSRYATWTGSSTGPVIFTNGYYNYYGRLYYPRITNIEVTYQAVN
jgi:hypothetical protein